MSTIAWDGKTMAADRLAWLGKHEPGHARKSKIHRLEDGSLVGISTNTVGGSTMLMTWIEEGMDPLSDLIKRDTPEYFSIIHVSPAGVVSYHNDSFWPALVDPGVQAIGSGGNYALGAMMHGASALEAVKIAATLDSLTAWGFDELRLDGSDAG
jgi:hypothetical protein